MLDAEIIQQIEDWKIRSILNANDIFSFFSCLLNLNVNITKRFVELDTSKVEILIDRAHCKLLIIF